MPPGIGASGIVGIAFETTPGTYVAPTKYCPIRNENLQANQETQWRRPIRGIVDVVGAVPGNTSFDGDIEMEALHDCVPYFIMASRNTFAKAGAGPYTYTFTPTHSAIVVTGRTLSITIVRNGIVFGYVGCTVTKQEYSLDNGLLIVKFSVMCMEESVQSAPTPTWPTSVPVGMGQYVVEIPTGATVLDTDEFTLSIDENGNNAYRMKTPSRGPAFIWMGERNIELSLSRDFLDRADYDAFKALTAHSVTIKAVQSASGEFNFKIPAALKDTYEVGLAGQGELLRANIKYQTVYDPATSKAYELMVKTTENIT